MSDVKINVRDKELLLVRGDVEAVDAEGNRFEIKDQFALCRCGGSARQPFCDGTHQNGFDDCVRAKNLL